MNMSASMARRAHYLPEAESSRFDYTAWSFEELRELARQLRISGAEAMSRRDLLDLFVTGQDA
jgi:hypothetical protein